jgi:hypothetical protein
MRKDTTAPHRTTSQVTRFLTAASARFEGLPLASLPLPVVLEVLDLPPALADSPELQPVLAHAHGRLQDLLGDLERVRIGDKCVLFFFIDFFVFFSFVHSGEHECV